MPVVAPFLPVVPVPMIHLRALQPDDAPPEYRGCLTDAAAGGVSLSFGLFDRDRLVGHLVCCGFKPTLFPGEIGEALHVRHVAVLPRYRRMLPRLVRRFGIEARRHYPGSSIEASAVESALGIWRAHPEFFARDGYAVTRHVDSGEMLDGEIRYLVRWQPIPDWEPEVPTVEQLVAPPRGRAVEVDDTRYETAVVREEREWDALAPVWDPLLLATPDHAVSQIYEYQRRWWRSAGGASELFIVLLAREGEAIGIAPLRVETVKVYGRWCRRLSWMGANRSALMIASLAPVVLTTRSASASRRSSWSHGSLWAFHRAASSLARSLLRLTTVICVAPSACR